MLTNLSIKDFAIVKDLSVDFKSGLNIITGETGAGKSIVIEAISMGLGSRADTAFVRKGADKATISLVVDIDDCNLKEYFEQIGVPFDNPTVIRREISSSSKSICRINGSIVPLSSLSGLCKKIADIHGQYDQQTLLDPDNHINILDCFADKGHKELLGSVATSYEEYADTVNKINSLKRNLADAERQRDFLSFELKEIDDAKLKPDEDEHLEESIKMMENSEKLYEALNNAFSNLFGYDDCADAAISNSLNSLESVKGISSDIDAIYKRLSDTYYELDDMNTELRSLRDSINFATSDLDESIERLELINKLKRKYGGSIESVLAYAEKSREKLNNIDNSSDLKEKLEQKLKLTKAKYIEEATKLNKSRKETASVLSKAIDVELNELNFKNAKFNVSIEKGEPSALGFDKVEFLLSANLGEDPKPLVKVASGGELSRIMLALKRIIGDVDSIPTMIFDEIDTGISGATAAVVGDKLVSIAKKHQVICITHLPQIACRGESHFKIEKTSDEISTSSTVVPLNTDERIDEIARLMSGSQITESARNQAKELLNI